MYTKLLRLLEQEGAQTSAGGTAAQNMVPIEDLMDSEIDDLKDLPTFEVPSKGHYKLAMTLERKVVNEHPTIQANLEVLEVLELSNPSDPAPEVRTAEGPGRKFGVLFMMDNEWGQGAFKQFIAPIAKGLGITKVGAAVEACKDEKIIAGTLKHRFAKEDSKKENAFANLVNCELL